MKKQPSEFAPQTEQQSLVLLAREVVADAGVKDPELFILLRALRKEYLLEKLRSAFAAEPKWTEVLVRSDLGTSVRLKEKLDSRNRAPRLNPDLFPDE